MNIAHAAAAAFEQLDTLKRIVESREAVTLKEINTLKLKVQKYEEFLHAINYAVTACNHERVRKLVDNAFKWSYAHRCGNGEYTDEEQQEIIDRALARLTEDGNV